MPYAKGIIIGRAIPGIDGLKPVQRRSLYTMYNMGLLNGKKVKSSNVVGQTMQLHPNGDAPIYEAMVRMTTGNESLNVPFIESKGNFGKVYSRDTAFAASRYTEVKLAPICKELFDGIKEDAVEMVPNFDNSKMEPSVLPVKFPTILTNPSAGVAVGLSSSIPSFGLENVCMSVVGMLDGSINDYASLVRVLGIPQFTVGANVHTTREDMEKFVEKGSGSFVMTGTFTTYSNKIVVSEIPFRTTGEAIAEQITEAVKSGDLKEVVSIDDEIDLDGFKMTIHLRKTANSTEVLKKLYRLTALRNSVHFNIRVVIGNECRTLGVYELLQEWIKFRRETIKRQYTYKKNEAKKTEHLLASWEIVHDYLDEVIDIIRNTDEDSVMSAKLMNRFSLDEIQAEYIMDTKLRKIKEVNVKKWLADLAETRKLIQEYTVIIDDDSVKDKIIIDEQHEIIKKYKTGENKTHLLKPFPEDFDAEKPAPVDDNLVTVVLTKNGYLKRLVSYTSYANWEPDEGDAEEKRWSARNNEYMLIFTCDGTVHKILVNDIDAGRGKQKDKIADILGVAANQIMFVDTAGDFSGYFNLVYPNGRGCRVYYSKASGKRAKYKSLYEPVSPNGFWITKSNKFFMVTKRRKASYCDLSNMGLFNTRTAFKVASVGESDGIAGLQPVENVPNIDAINLDKYKKPYCISIGEDELWEGSRARYLEYLDKKRNGRTNKNNKK